MTQKENAPTANSNESAPNNRAHYARLSPREARVLAALASATGWIAREAIDRIACASNGPAVFQALRRKLGNDAAIEMECVPVIDADGKTAQAGRYRLSDTHRAQAVALLGGGHHA